MVVRSTMTNHLQVQLSAECWVLGAGFGAGLCAEVKLTLNLSAEKQKKKGKFFYLLNLKIIYLLLRGSSLDNR